MNKIKAKLIIEIMGRPPEHVKEALNTLVVRLGSEKGVSLLDKQYHKPKPIEKSKDLFIAFSDVDIEFDNIESFFNILMGYMPAHAEIYEPEKFKLDASNLNDLGNFILGKLHRYDSIAKRALMERNVLSEQLNKLKSGTAEKEGKKIEKKPTKSKKAKASLKK